MDLILAFYQVIQIILVAGKLTLDALQPRAIGLEKGAVSVVTPSADSLAIFLIGFSFFFFFF